MNGESLTIMNAVPSGQFAVTEHMNSQSKGSTLYNLQMLHVLAGKRCDLNRSSIRARSHD